MVVWKVTPYKGLYSDGHPSQIKYKCDVCEKYVKYENMFAIRVRDYYIEAWVCSEICVNMYILSKI